MKRFIKEEIITRPGVVFAVVVTVMVVGALVLMLTNS